MSITVGGQCVIMLQKQRCSFISKHLVSKHLKHHDILVMTCHHKVATSKYQITTARSDERVCLELFLMDNDKENDD